MNKKTKATIITNIICCIVVLFMSVGYSNFSKKLTADEILASVRIAEDIRVNSVAELERAGEATTSYVNYDHKSIEGTINLPTTTSSVTYIVEILNISATEYEISSVSGLPEALDYEIIDYNLGDKICVEDKCSLGIFKPIKVKIKYKEGAVIPANPEYNFELIFNFQEYQIKDIHINEIANEILSNDGASASLPTYKDTTANFAVNLPNNNSTIEYDINILNNSKEIKTLKSIETLLNSNGADVDYRITGININEYFAPKESKKAHIKIYVKPESTATELSTTQLSILFNFETIEWKPLKIEFMSANSSGDLNIDSEIPFEIKVTNENAIDATYDLTIDDEKFIIRDINKDNTEYQIKANETLTNIVYISIRDDVTYETKTKELELMLKVIYPTKRDRNVQKITLDLPSVFQTTVLTSHDIEEAPPAYSDVEDTEGHLMRTNEFDDLDSIYYFRGVIDDNYVKFADQLWRITRVNYDGNIRLVLNENVSTDENTQVLTKFSNNYTGTGDLDTVDEGLAVVDYRNSDLKKVVDAWYEANIATKEESKYVVDSKFCADLNYDGPITTPDEHTVYYFTFIYSCWKRHR